MAWREAVESRRMDALRQALQALQAWQARWRAPTSPPSPLSPTSPMRLVRDAMGRLLAAASITLAGVMPASAAKVSAVSPSGEVPEVRQVSVRFDQAVVAAGDPRAPAPFTLRCNGQEPKADARWAAPTQWLLDLREPLPAGAGCVLQAVSQWQPIAGTFEGPREFRFSTGAPTVVQTRPWHGGVIDEEQHFLLRLSGAVDRATLAGNAWCEVEGLGERLPLQLASDKERDAVLRTQHVRAGTTPQQWLLVHCGRPFPAAVGVRLVWGAGIAALAVPGQATLQTRAPRNFQWKVRARFTAEFSCERERANAPCLPLRPLALRFSAPVPREQALAVRLVPSAGTPGSPAARPIAPAIDPANANDRAAQLGELRFAAPLPENTRFALTLPANLRDADGRALANAASFPLSVATGGLPPLAKFAAAPFGIVEAGRDGEPALLPMSLRQVQADLQRASTSGQVSVKRLDAATSDETLLRWFAKLDRWHESDLTAKELGRPREEWQESVRETGEDGRERVVRRERRIATREVSMLANESGVQRAELPQLVSNSSGNAPRATEVVGVPLPQTGYHVVEVGSRILGESLLARPAPMFARSGVLVTNLALHFKIGRSSSLAWVTTLDRARPVAGARVVVNDCRGKALWSGLTDAQGLARIERGWDESDRDLGGEDCLGPRALFVTARRADPSGAEDLAFVFSHWTKGIEPWRFNVAVGGTRSATAAHSVLDRSLVRAGETVSMKHFVRRESERGLERLNAEQLPDSVLLRHEGSGQEVLLPLAWPAGGRSAESRWEVPRHAKLGLYEVVLRRGNGVGTVSGNLRVEAFRVPLTAATLAGPKGVHVAPQKLSFAAQLNMGAGGPLPRTPMALSALLRPAEPRFAGYDGFRFEPPRPRAGTGGDADEDSADEAGRLVADRIAARSDAQGAATLVVDKLPSIERPSELTAELSYADPNGETQTVTQRLRLWPASVVVGIRTRNWAATRGSLRWDVVVLDTQGVPLKERELQVHARQVQTTSVRRRIVGGFYAYDNQTRLQDLGVLCKGRSDAQGRLACEAAAPVGGEIELIAGARDEAGRESRAAATLWVVGDDEQWFAQENDDRIDVLPERRELQPGESVKLQVRMPFREATALVSVEREGVIATQIVTLRGREPVVEVKVPESETKANSTGTGSGSIAQSWAPNVYVSVLVLRGRLRDVPWTSFFRWGWRDPLDWWRAFRYEGRDWRAPTAMVDLAKPSFRLGVAELKIGRAAHRLEVKVTPERSVYGVRETVRTKVSVSHGGKPAAGAELAFAAVDEGLLALRENQSWKLLEGLLRDRPWGVATATAQGEVIGRRHFGRKTLPPGGDGGANPTRELFDTLLVWRGRVTLDARGEATIDVPLNDSLTSFRLVAIADDGEDRFGTGSASVRVSQELQLFSGLPPVVRDGDRLEAALTLRNASTRAMKLRVTLEGSAAGGGSATGATLKLPEQSVELAAGAAQLVRWSVDVPAGSERIEWSAAAEEQAAPAGAKPARDRARFVQRVAPAVPMRVWQALLQQLDATVSLPYAPPADALAWPGSTPPLRRGGVEVSLQPHLAGALPGLRRYFESYPYTCIEQRSSRAIALGDEALWAQVRGELAAHLDRDGLAAYFPLRDDDRPQGSDRLTAHLVAAAHEAGREWPRAELERMLSGLAAFVEGRTLRRFTAPREDLPVRKLAALEALSRYGRAVPRMLGSISITPQQWPTAALLDWWALLRRVEAMPDRAARLAEVQALLRARLVAGGTTLRFTTEDDDRWWWLMDGPDANAARLVLAAVESAAWKDEVAQLVTGHLGRARNGAWNTTVANLWSMLALQRFSARFASAPVAGVTTLAFGQAVGRVDWSAQSTAAAPSAASAAPPLRLPWPAGSAAMPLVATHQGSGRPWLAVQALAAVPITTPISAGYRVQRSVSAVERAKPDAWSVGDVLRVRLEIDAVGDLAWVVVSDPLPAGAAVLGSGLGRDSAIAARGTQREGSGVLAYEERAADAWRAYYEWLPRGKHVIEYTLRLNSAGRLQLPPTRVEAMYAPESFGEAPNAAIDVRP